MKFTRYIRDPIHGKIGLTETEYAVLGSVELQRLNRLRQVQLVHQVYPGATHTRLAHSIGTLATVTRMINGSGLTDALGATQIEDVRLAALLHEATRTALGHLVERQFAHVLPPRDDVRELMLTGKLRDYWLRYTPLPPDEFAPERSQFVADILGEERCAAVGEILSRRPRPERAVLSGLINGPLGAHTLDFLRRDSHAVGLPHVEYDDAIFSGFDVEQGPQGPRLVLSDHPVVLSAAADVLYARWYLYRHVFLHHAVLAANAMVIAAMRRAIPAEDMPALYVCGDDDVLVGLATGRGIGRESKQPATTREATEARALASALLKRELYKRVYATTREAMRQIELDFPEARRPEVEAGLLDRCRRYEPRALLAFPPETPAYDDSSIMVRGGKKLRGMLSELELETVDRYDDYYKRLDRLYVIVPGASLQMRETIQGGLATFLPPNVYAPKPFVPSVADIRAQIQRAVRQIVNRNKRRLAKYLWLLAESEGADQVTFVRCFGISPSMVSQDLKQLEEIAGGQDPWLSYTRGATKRWAIPVPRHREFVRDALVESDLKDERVPRPPEDELDLGGRT